MEHRDLIWEIQKTIIEIYYKHDLINLRGLNNDYQLNGKQILLWYSEVTRKCAVNYNGQFNYFKTLDDLFFCSDELLYFTAHLFLYRPYINNPIEDGFYVSERTVYPNYQNLEAKRYSMYADITSQKAYNYWDRIGDLIASFFPNKLKPHQIFFPSAIDCIPEQFHASSNYTWLKEFKEVGYQELNRIRKQIVHYTTSDTDYKYKHLDNSSDRQAMEILQAEREGLAEFYKRHIGFTLQGFEKTLYFLEELNQVLFAELE